MRWRNNKQKIKTPEIYDECVIRYFVWLPTTAEDGYVYWLESIWITMVFLPIDHRIKSHTKHNSHFVCLYQGIEKSIHEINGWIPIQFHGRKDPRYPTDVV